MTVVAFWAPISAPHSPPRTNDITFDLAEDTIALFYQGFRVAGGALYFACVDCTSASNRGTDAVAVDAHDTTENGTQPAVSCDHSPRPLELCVARPRDSGLETAFDGA